MFPIKTPGLLWDAKAVTPASSWVDAAQGQVQMTGNSQFGANCANAIYVGGTGRVDIILMHGGSPVTFLAVTAGIWMGMPPFRHLNVVASGGATGIVVGITAG